MKTKILGAFCALLLSAVSALPATFTANFDSLTNHQGVIGTSYTENGITFTSPTQFGVATGMFGAALFGWGGYIYQGNALYVSNGGWVCLTTGGNMTSVSFSGGFDWNGYMIEYNQLDVFFEWCAKLDGVEVATALVPLSYPGRTAHQFFGSVNPGLQFDELLIRSTAVMYPNGRDVGAPVTYGQGSEQLANHIAFDNVRVARVPDTGNGALMFAACLLLLAVRGFRHD